MSLNLRLTAEDKTNEFRVVFNLQQTPTNVTMAIVDSCHTHEQFQEAYSKWLRDLFKPKPPPEWVEPHLAALSRFVERYPQAEWWWG